MIVGAGGTGADRDRPEQAAAIAPEREGKRVRSDVHGDAHRASFDAVVRLHTGVHTLVTTWCRDGHKTSTLQVESVPMSRADLHCHSTASEVSKLGVQRALGLPECATPPEEVYELAKRRGMDFVTITDHDTIDGALAIADRPDVFVSEELTCWFRGEPQAVHVLVWGIGPEQHDWLQVHAGDVEQVPEYLREQEIACALAHPFYAVRAPL